MDAKSFLLFSSTFCLMCLSVSADRDLDGEPTATLSLVNSGNGARNRYALQVSGDQLTDYLRTLRQVPDSIYDGAHIITDMDESSLSPRYDNQDDSPDDGKYYNERIPAMRLVQQQEEDQQQQEEEDPEDYNQKKRYPQEEDYESSSSRRNVEYDTAPSSRKNEYRLPVRMSDYLRSRDLFLRREEASSDQEVKVSDLPQKESSRLKEYLRPKDMEESKEEVISVKDQRPKTEIDAPVVDKSMRDQERKRDSSDNKEIDLKTVRELLNTLIKQIENIQTAAKALPIPLPAQNPPIVPTRKEYSRDEMEAVAEHDPIPKKVKYSNFESKKKQIKKQKPNNNEKTVFLKPQDVMKMLTGANLPDDFLPEMAPIRRTRGPYMTSLGGGRGVRPFFPIPIPFGGYPGGYKK